MSLLEEAFWGAGWDEAKHPRHPEGTEDGGKFAPKTYTTVFNSGDDLREWHGVTDTEWEDYAATGLYNEAIAGELREGDLTAYGDKIDAADVEEMVDAAKRIEKAASTHAVDNDDRQAAADGVLYRGDSFEDEGAMRAAFRKGATIVTKPLTATSTSTEAPLIYAHQGMDPGEGEGLPVLITFRSIDGKHMGVQTAPMGVPTNEVVMPGGQSYQVMDEPYLEDGVWRVTLYRGTVLPKSVPVRKVMEGIQASAWDESKHPRHPGGDERGGQFRSADDVRKANPKVDLTTTENEKAVVLRMIESKERGQGHASKAIDDLIRYADESGKPIYLHAESIDPAGLSSAELREWYKRHGFEKTKRSMEDLEHDGTMVYRPKDTTPWEDREWVDPPKPRGIHAGIGGAGGYTTDRAETTLTEMGREGEALFREIAGESELMHLPGKGEQSPLDVKVGNWGFEVKSVDADSTSFKATPKKHEMASKEAFAEKHGLIPAIAIVVIDRKAGIARAYYRRGLKGGRLSKNTGWLYMGETKLPQQASAWDEAKHPRHEEGTPVGGQFKSKFETDILPASVETTRMLYDQLLEAHNQGLWPVGRGEDEGGSHFGRPGMDLNKGVSSGLSHAMAAIEGGSREEIFMQGDYNEDEWDEMPESETPVFFVVVRNEDGLPVAVMDFAELPDDMTVYGGAAGATKGAGLPLFSAFVETVANRGKGATWSAGNARAAALYDRLGIPRNGSGAYYLNPENAAAMAKDLFALARSRTAALEAMVAAGWVEEDHPRHPEGTKVGGQFRSLYHVSPVKNRQSIRERGLLPDAEKRYTDSGEGVYVFGSRDEAWRFATTGERMYGDSDIWEISNTGLELEPDPFFEEGHPMAERAIAQMGEKPAAFKTGVVTPEKLTLHPNPWHPDPETDRRLAGEALSNWVGDPSTMSIHMMDEINGEEPRPGPATRYREQAAALLQAVREGGANTKRLYRGASKLDPSGLGIPESWTESKTVAKRFAGKDGTVYTIEPGEAHGVRMRDYIQSGMDVNVEKQWLIDPLTYPPHLRDNMTAAVLAALKALVGGTWREEDHPRDPGGEGGGQWITKGTVAADEDIAPAVRLPKFQESKALRDRLYELDVEQALGTWVLDSWGNWSDQQQRDLKAWLDKQLFEGGWEKVWVEDLHPPREVSRRLSSGMLSVDYSREIGMSYALERKQARALVLALEKHIAYNEAVKYGFDPVDYASDLFAPKEAKAKAPSPRDQGIPDIYLSEKGTFKPGYDAKLKSDLVNSYFELHPRKSRIQVGKVTPETKQDMIDDFAYRNPSLLVSSDGVRYTDEELWPIVQRDFNDPAQSTRFPPDTKEIFRRYQKEIRTRQITESTLLHRFPPEVAKRILEERGWTKFLDQKRDKMRGMLERDIETADKFKEGFSAQLKSEMKRAHGVWGFALDVRGERFGLVQAQVGELAHLEPEIAKGLKAAGVKVYVGPGPSTDLDEMWHLKDERARGWGNTYLDKVGGFYSPSSRSVIVSATAPSSDQGLMAHEIGHAIGDVYDIDNHDELNRYHHKLYNQVRSYFRQGGKGSRAGRQELWAEGVSAVLRNRMEGEFDRRAIGAGKKDTGPFKEYDYDALSPEAKDYLDWVDKTLREIAEGRHIAS